MVRTGPSDASHALEAFTAVAQAVIEAVESAPPGRVAVGGQGIVAELVRRLLPSDRYGSDGPLAALVDTTGEAPTVEQGVEQVCDLGVVVLAAGPHGAEPVVDVYRDIHRRGLTIVGLADPPSLTTTPDGPQALDALVIDLLDPPHLVTVQAGQLAPPTGRWYRVTSADSNESDG